MPVPWSAGRTGRPGRNLRELGLGVDSVWMKNVRDCCAIHGVAWCFRVRDVRGDARNEVGVMDNRECAGCRAQDVGARDARVRIGGREVRGGRYCARWLG